MIIHVIDVSVVFVVYIPSDSELPSGSYSVEPVSFNVPTVNPFTLM